jgi:RNA polymerase sigma-70 factor (ECF subfamily)
MVTSFATIVDGGTLDAYRARLVQRARSLVGAADAEDVVQDAFERALRATTARPGSDPLPWLNRITRNVAYDRLKSRARKSLMPIPAVDTESAERSVVRRETVAELGCAFLELPAAQRRTIVLHDVQGYSNVEIATLDQVPYHTVRTRLNRARQAVRIALGSMGS